MISVDVFNMEAMCRLTIGLFKVLELLANHTLCKLNQTNGGLLPISRLMCHQAVLPSQVASAQPLMELKAYIIQLLIRITFKTLLLELLLTIIQSQQEQRSATRL
jgi:hypothetical protein